MGDGRINGAIQIFRGPTLVTMVTKIGLFSHKPGITRLVQFLEPRSSHQTYGVFGDGQFNGAIYIFSGPTLVAMGTKIGLFWHKIVYNSAVVLGPHWDLEGHVRNCQIYSYRRFAQ